MLANFCDAKSMSFSARGLSRKVNAHKWSREYQDRPVGARKGGTAKSMSAAPTTAGMGMAETPVVAPNRAGWLLPPTLTGEVEVRVVAVGWAPAERDWSSGTALSGLRCRDQPWSLLRRGRFDGAAVGCADREVEAAGPVAVEDRRRGGFNPARCCSCSKADSGWPPRPGSARLIAFERDSCCRAVGVRGARIDGPLGYPLPQCAQ